MNQAVNDCLAVWNSIGKVFCGYAAGAFIQSALLVILLLVIDLLLRQRVRAVFRYGVWLLVLVKLVLPPTLSLPSGIGYWVGNRLPAASPVSQPFSDAIGYEPARQHRYAGPEPSGGIPQGQPSPSIPEMGSPLPPVTLPWTPVTWQAVVLLLWLGGVLAFAALLAQRLRFVRALVAASTPARGDLLGLLEQCRSQMGVRRAVGLRMLDTVPSPAVCGLRRPIILMPTTLVEKLSPEGLRAALIHELAHIQRADLWINAVQTFLQVVYFYNPFVWLANAAIRRTCEEAVDETVLVTLGGQAKSYSNTLIDISEMAFWKADFGLRLIGVAESRRALQGRIKHMLTRPTPQSARIGALGTIAILVVAAVLLPMARAERSNQDTPVTSSAAGAGAAEKVPQGAWYYHVKTGGTGGQPVQSEADPGLSSCWNSIMGAFRAVKSRATPGPWIIQVDDEAIYDEAVALTDLQTSLTETLTLTKAPWLAGRPTIYPSQPGKRALAINGLWKGVATSEPLPDQPGQPAHRVTYLTIRGFTLKNNAQGTDKTTEQPLFTDNQTYLSGGLHIIEDCCFDGQNQVYDSTLPMFVGGTCINTVFRRNVFRDLRRNEEAMKEGGDKDLFALTPPKSTVLGEPQVTMADNTFVGNRGTVFICVGDLANRRHYRSVFERNTLRANCSYSRLAYIGQNPLSNIVRNNIFSDNAGGTGVSATLTIVNASNTKVYHNTFFNNHVPQEVAVDPGSTDGIEVKNNIFWPTPGSYCIGVARGCTENLVCANNAFFTDFHKDGYPPGFGFTTTENTEIVGSWDGKPMTTDAWNKASKNNMGNGYTFEGPGLGKDMRLIAGSLCIDCGVSGLVSDDIGGRQRPVGTGCDIGADEYGTAGAGRPRAGEPEPPLEGQRLAPGAPLHLAVYRGDVARIEQCLQEGADVNKLDGRGYTPLHYAVQNSQQQAMELLLAKGSDVNVKDSRGQTPLFCAIAVGNRDVAELLVSKGADVNVKNSDGQTPLLCAIAAGHGKVAELLISRGADVNAKTKDGQTPLFGAITGGQWEVARLLISKGADVNAKNKDGQTPLDCAVNQNRKEIVEPLTAKGAEGSIHTAIRLGDMDRVRNCLEKGADVNANDKNGQTPLHLAVNNELKDVAELLISKGADLNAKDRMGYTPLYDAIWNEDQDMTRLLVTKGADVSHAPKDDYPPLHYAVWNEDVNTVKLLLDHGAKFDVKDQDGSTALREAAGHGAREVLQVFIAKGADVSTLPLAAGVGDLARVKSLLEQGADVNAKDELGWTLLHWAAGQEEVAAFLIGRGASVDAKRKDDRTPLHQAAQAGVTHLVELLISKGADVNAKDKAAETPLHLAASAGHREVVELLITKGAGVNAKNWYDRTSLHNAALRGHKEAVEVLIRRGADMNARDKDGRTPLMSVYGRERTEIVELLRKHGAKE